MHPCGVICLDWKSETRTCTKNIIPTIIALPLRVKSVRGSKVDTICHIKWSALFFLLVSSCVIRHENPALEIIWNATIKSLSRCVQGTKNDQHPKRHSQATEVADYRFTEANKTLTFDLLSLPISICLLLVGCWAALWNDWNPGPSKGLATLRYDLHAVTRWSNHFDARKQLFPFPLSNYYSCHSFSLKLNKELESSWVRT